MNLLVVGEGDKNMVERVSLSVQMANQSGKYWCYGEGI